MGVCEAQAILSLMEFLVHVDPSGSVTTFHTAEPPLPKIIQLETKWKGCFSEERGRHAHNCLPGAQPSHRSLLRQIRPFLRSLPEGACHKGLRIAECAISASLASVIPLQMEPLGSAQKAEMSSASVA